jgi:hypothetical protein
MATSLVAALAVTAWLFATARAEVELPRENPPARVAQQVGLTEIVVEYDSPAVNGRRIWGALVPYGAPWAISASQATTVRFSKDVSIAGKPVPAGSYRLSVTPEKATWTFLLAKGDLEFIRVASHPRPAPFRERLAFLFSDFSADKASLNLEWEKVRVALPITTNTARQVQATIAELDDAWRSYANAARFMLESKKDYDAGLRYANQSLALKDDWYTRWIKAALLAAKHDYKTAVDEGQRAYDLGQQLGDAFVLEPELKKALADWRNRRGPQ